MSPGEALGGEYKRSHFQSSACSSVSVSVSAVYCYEAAETSPVTAMSV